MKAAVFHEHGSSDNIKWEDFPDPVCGPDDAVIEIKAAVERIREMVQNIE